MSDEPIFLKSGDSIKNVNRPGKIFKLMVKSKNMEAIIAEMEPNSSSRWYIHDGEELHYVLNGQIEYDVGEKTYKLHEGELLWHKSSVKHRARNITNKKAKYATVGTPPSFMIE